MNPKKSTHIVGLMANVADWSNLSKTVDRDGLLAEKEITGTILDPMYRHGCCRHFRNLGQFLSLIGHLINDTRRRCGRQLRTINPARTEPFPMTTEERTGSDSPFDEIMQTPAENSFVDLRRLIETRIRKSTTHSGTNDTAER